MPRVRVSAAAARELEGAAAWYEREQPGLGTKLLDEFEHAVALLEDDMAPLLSMPGEAGRKGAKRLLMHRYPFSIIVFEQDGARVIVALAHQSRKPGYWISRPPT